jgi:hypothetical protein
MQSKNEIVYHLRPEELPEGEGVEGELLLKIGDVEELLGVDLKGLLEAAPKYFLTLRLMVPSLFCLIKLELDELLPPLNCREGPAAPARFALISCKTWFGF